MATKTPPIMYADLLSVIEPNPSLGAAVKILCRYILGPKLVDFKKGTLSSVGLT